jgi:hypothetical protein
VEVWLLDGWYAGKAELVRDEEERAQVLPKLLKNGGAAFKVWERVNWLDLPEEEQTELPVLRIKRQSPCTGAEGPGSLAWLWPFLLLVFTIRLGRKRK